MPVPRQSLQSIVDRLLDEGLVEYLTERKAAGVSNNDIAHDLRTRLDITVTAEAVRKWADARGIKKAEKVA
jgi:hypothetical protein